MAKKDKFESSFLNIKKPSCSSCVWRSKVNLSVCVAFPRGIPVEILTGKNDHKEPYKGDNGIQFKEKE